MKEKLFIAVQIVAGLMLVVFGLNKFLQFMPAPDVTAEMGAYLGALFKTGYIFPIAGIVYLLAGVAFLVNKYAALAAVILMPVILNAFLAHLFLDPAGMGGALLLTILTIIIMIRHKQRYQALFTA